MITDLTDDQREALRDALNDALADLSGYQHAPDEDEASEDDEDDLGD